MFSFFHSSHECYRFLNTFIISLSVSQSGERALEEVSLDLKGEEKEIFEAIAQLSLEERIAYFARYFENSSYTMFLSIFQLYENQGGDVLEVAEPLLKEVTLQEETGDAMPIIPAAFRLNRTDFSLVFAEEIDLHNGMPGLIVF